MALFADSIAKRSRQHRKKSNAPLLLASLPNKPPCRPTAASKSNATQKDKHRTAMCGMMRHRLWGRYRGREEGKREETEQREGKETNKKETKETATKKKRETKTRSKES